VKGEGQKKQRGLRIKTKKTPPGAAVDAGRPAALGI